MDASPNSSTAVSRSSSLRQNVSVGIGFGLTRVFGGGDSYDVPSVLPALRLVNIGIAF